MRHAVMLHELRAEILLEKMFQDKLVAYTAASQMGEPCGEFQRARDLVAHIQAARSKGIGTLHYVFHGEHLGGKVSRRPIQTPLMQREEMVGEGLIHLYMESRGSHDWLVRMDVPHCTAEMDAEKWNSKAIEEQGFRLRRLMRTFANSPQSSTRYLRGEHTPA